MEIPNYDYLNEDYEKLPMKNGHFLMPDWPFFMAIVGPTKCGKSNLMMYIVTELLYFDRLYIFATKSESKYRHLRDFMLGVCEKKIMKTGRFPLVLKYEDYTDEQIDLLGQEELEDYYDELDLYEAELDKLFKESFFIGGYDDIPNGDQQAEFFDKHYQNLVIFDDMVIIKNQKKIEEMYIKGRNENCSLIYLSQSYSGKKEGEGIPSIVRKQLNFIVIFKEENSRVLNELRLQMCAWIPKDKFIQLFDEATHADHGFVVIDKDTKDKPKRFRMGFDSMVNPDKIGEPD